MKKNYKLLITLILLIIATVSLATTSENISMVVGPLTGSYRVFGLDIAQQALKEGIAIDIKESSGDIENIKRLASHENAGFTIIDEAILSYLQSDPELKTMANKLRVIYPFYNAEVHVLGKVYINNMNDLNGKKVVVGLKGSGTNFTASNLFKALQINPIKEYLPFSDGIEKLLKGEVDAVMYVAGKPVPLFDNLAKLAGSHPELLSNIHFIPIYYNEALSKAGLYNAMITPRDYAIIKQDIPTIATKNLLVSFNFSEENTAYGNLRCKQLKLITKAIGDNLPELKKIGHPKWNEVDLNADIGDFKRSGCVYNAIPANGLSTVKNCLVNGVCQ